MDGSSKLSRQSVGQHFSASLEPAYIRHGDSASFGSGVDGAFVSSETLSLELQNSLSACSTELLDIGSTLKSAASIYELKHDATERLTEVPCQNSKQKPSTTSASKRRPKRRTALLIASSLNELQYEDPERIVIVRKINRLGFASGDILKKYFERFGTVLKVHLSNSHNKQISDGSAPGNCQIRLRPSGIGFVLFEHEADAKLALAAGTTQMIETVEVVVRGFEVRRDDIGTATADDTHETVKQEDQDTEDVLDSHDVIKEVPWPKFGAFSRE